MSSHYKASYGLTAADLLIMVISLYLPHFFEVEKRPALLPTKLSTLKSQRAKSKERSSVIKIKLKNSIGISV